MVEPGARAQAADAAARGRRRQPGDRARRDAGTRRRIRLRQVDRGALDRRPLRADAREHPLRRHRAGGGGGAGDLAGGAAHGASGHADDLPGPLCQPQPALAGGRHRRRADTRTVAGHAAAGARRPRRCAAAAGRSRRRRSRQVPAPVLGRAAAADLDRPRTVDRAALPGLRRADVGARRLGAGAGAEPDARPAAPDGSHLPLHLAQPRGRPPRRRPRRCHVPRTDRRAGPHPAAVRRAAAPVHPDAAGGGAGPFRRRTRTGRGRRRGAESARAAAGLHVPSALPSRRRALPARGTGAAALRRRRRGRLPRRRGGSARGADRRRPARCGRPGLPRCPIRYNWRFAAGRIHGAGATPRHGRSGAAAPSPDHRQRYPNCA